MLKKAAAPSAPVTPPLVSGQILIFGVQAWLVGYLALVVLHVACYQLALACRGTRLDMLSKAPQLAAHFLPQLICFALAVYWAAFDWLFRGTIPEDAMAFGIGGYLPEGERIACLMLAFQLYELSACIPDGTQRLRGTVNELVGHHVTVVILSYLVYYHQAFQYFAPVFMGVPEVSSLPLTIVDLFRQFPTLKQSFPATNELARNVFAVTFLGFRAVYWPLCSITFWRACLAAHAGPAMAGVSTWVVYVFEVANVLMTCLQWYWASIILGAIVSMATGGKPPKDD